MKNRICSVLWFLLLPVAAVAGAEDEFDAAAVFTSRCGACHTVGQGDEVGPDLKGVTERRDRTWLVSFVQSSQSVIGAGDQTAVELFERYGRQKMPDHPYTAEQVGEILAFIEAGGPASRPAVRLAETATADEVLAGRDHFFGRSGQGTSCASCHTVDPPSRAASLYLGGSLAGIFSRYGDLELARALTRDRGVCRRALETEESFLVRAYLRHMDMPAGGGDQASAELFAMLGVGLAALLFGLGGLFVRGTVHASRLRPAPSPGGVS